MQLNNTHESSTIVLEDNDPSLEWVMESQSIAFDNEDLSWLNLDPLPHQQDVNIDVG